MQRSATVADESPSRQTAEPKRSAWRAVTLGAIGVPLCDYWLVHMNSVSFNALPTTISIFFHVVFILFVLCLVNVVLGRWLPRIAFSAGELCLLYAMLCVGSVPAGLDCTLILSAVVGAPMRMATPENRWGELFLNQIPDWLVVKDASAAKWFFEGGSSLFLPEIFRHWLAPMVAWGLFLFALWMGTMALSCLFRRRWIESERLTYPVVQMPIEMARNTTAFLENGALWGAFAVAFLIDLTNGLHTINPLFPMVPVRATHPPFDLGPRLADPPWNAVGFFPMGFYPMVIGLTLLMPSELAFSCVFFLFYWKALRVLSAWLGFTATPRAPWIEEQNFGGYLGVAAFSIWASRHYLAQALRWAIRPSADEAREPLRYRDALLLFLLCVGLVVGFSRAAGMAVWLALLIFAGYYGISLAIGRIRAELGLPVHDLHFAGPDTMAVNVMGSRLLGPRNTIVSALFWGFNRAYRNHPMPHQAEALHISARTDVTERAVLLGLTVALFLGCMAAMPIYAAVSYKYGAAAKMPPHIVWRTDEIYGKLAARLDQPTLYDPKSLVAIAVGFAVLITGMALKTRLPWWPIHPIGFAVSGTWSMQLLWCPMAIGWAVKTCAVRYGGYQVMRRIAPIAFGLMLGDISGGCMWAILGMLKNKTYYMIWE